MTDPRREGVLSDRAVQDRLKEQRLQMEARDAADLDALMRTDFGRRLYYRLVFRLAGLESPSYQASGQVMAYQEGRRSLAIVLKDEAQAVCPELWIRMLQERLAVAEQESARRREAMSSQGNGAA
jgi:hypothetical protein